MRPALLLLLLGAAACAPAGAQDAPRDADLFFGAGGCASQACHGGGTVERQEYKVWATRDRHAKAFHALSGELGKRIGDRLGIDPPRARECLACHGAIGVRAAATFDPSDGVSCELCHGAAGRWLGEHAGPDFRKLQPAEKEQLGLRDLTTPEKRAAACVPCHVGGEGRVIPHAMMAAGHPELVFDLAKFLRDMPPHWKDEGWSDAQAWADGAKAAAAARLRLAASFAADGRGWPEFAAFDCNACHHPVGGGYVRAGRPGDLPVDLSALEVLAAAGDEKLVKSIAALGAPTFQPGGDRRAFAEEAARAAAAVEQLRPSPTPETWRPRLDAYLARIESGEIHANRPTMVQVAYAVSDLAPVRDGAAFTEAYDALSAALARPYDARECAALARKALAAR